MVAVVVVEVDLEKAAPLRARLMMRRIEIRIAVIKKSVFEIVIGDDERLRRFIEEES